MTIQKQIHFDVNDLAIDLYGSQNCNLKRLEEITGVQIHVRGNVATITGKKKDVKQASQAMESLYEILTKGYTLHPRDVDQAVSIISKEGKDAFEEVFQDAININGSKRPVTPKSIAQRDYIHTIQKSDIVFGIGPAGTGKTYLAIAKAVEAFHKKQIKKIVLTRPAVEAGEKLGFLPGNLTEKVDPYLRPIYDALYDMMDPEKVNRLMERGDIEVAPLAFMRGRTLNEVFVILDEAQNTTSEQMKMFLTRVGNHTKAVITGDITQIDLPNGVISGLVEAHELLDRISGVHFCWFSDRDVVRHPLVKEIIKAYERKNSQA